MKRSTIRPFVILKRVWNYCTYNKPFFILILILFGILNYVEDFYSFGKMGFLYFSLINVLIFGYGMTITRDRISGGFRLPKIVVFDVLNLGIKSSIVFGVFVVVQGLIMGLVCYPLNFPDFNLEEMLTDFPQTLHTLFSHDPVDTFTFIVLGAIVFYVTTFFIEIALARLADTGSLLSAFNLLEIEKDISLLGWRNYAKDYTFIVLAIVIISYLGELPIPNPYLNYLWVILSDLFIFATQFMGIGAIYSIIKEKKSNLDDDEYYSSND